MLSPLFVLQDGSRDALEALFQRIDHDAGIKQITLPEFLRVFGGGGGDGGAASLDQTGATAASAAPPLMLTDNSTATKDGGGGGGVTGGASPGGGLKKQLTAAQTIAAFGMQLGELGSPPKLQAADSMEGKYPPIEG